MLAKSHVVILSFLTKSEDCCGHANANMQHLQQLQPRHAVAQLKQNTRKSDHLLDILSQHMRPQSCWLSHVVILSFLTNSEDCCGHANANMQHLQQLQPRHAVAQLKQNTRKSDHLLDILSQHMRPQSCWLSHVVILSLLTNSEDCCGHANTHMQHLQQLQPRHALAQLKQNTRKSDHLLDFLSQHMRPQSCWLSHVVILSLLTNSEDCCGHANTHMQHLQQLQPRHALAQLKQNTRKSDHLLDFLSQHMRPQSCWLSHVVILYQATNDDWT